MWPFKRKERVSEALARIAQWQLECHQRFITMTITDYYDWLHSDECAALLAKNP
jgi:hypothetical protein